MEDTKVKRRIGRVTMPGGFGAGVGAAIAMMLVMAFLRFTSNTISIPELMEDSLTHLAGGQVEAFFINNLGVGGKALLLVMIIEGTLLAGGVLGFLYTRFWPGVGGRWLSGLLYGLVVGAFLNLVFLPIVGQGFLGVNAISATAPPEISQALYGTELAPFGIPVAVSMFILSIVFGLTLAALLPWKAQAPTKGLGSRDQGLGTRLQSPIPNPQSPIPAPSHPSLELVGDRRDFMKVMGGATAALVGGGVLWYGIREALAPPPIAGPELVEGEPGSIDVAEAPPHEPSNEPTPDMPNTDPTPPVPEGFEGVKPRLVPEVTPTNSFYITTKNFLDPTVDGASWTLAFKGLVDNPYSLNLDDLKALPAEDRTHTLACISNSVGGSLIGNGRWKGTDFGEMLKKAKPKAGVVDVIVRAADGYADSFSLDAGLNNGCLLAYEMNGQPLNQKHGYPARLLVPGIFGMKNCKWITEVELVDTDFKGYWQSRGWSDPAPYLTMSRIDYPNQETIEAKPVYVGGIAFAGERGIKRVEVTTDGGQTWNDASVRKPTGKHTWVLWTYPWRATQPGTYSLQVRATDGTGEAQTSEVQDTFPDGATGYHSKKIRVA